MVRGGAGWCVVVRGSAWWRCVVVRGGAWWCVVVRGSAWWCVVDECDDGPPSTQRGAMWMERMRSGSVHVRASVSEEGGEGGG